MIKKSVFSVTTIVLMISFLFGCTPNFDKEKLYITEPKNLKLISSKAKLFNIEDEQKVEFYVIDAIKTYNTIIKSSDGVLSKPQYREYVANLVEEETELKYFEASTYEWEVVEPILESCSGLTSYYYDYKKNTEYVSYSSDSINELKSNLEKLIIDNFEVEY